MDYYSKYVKYKIKYTKLNLLSPTNTMVGGSKKRSCHERWCQMVKKRNKELERMVNTKSYIPFNKLSSRDRIYYTHDNGGRPFKVVANSSGIYVYKKEKQDDDDEDEDNEDDEENDEDNGIYTNLVFKVNKFLGYWTGFDSSPYKMHGNSVLIRVKNNRYIFVGWNIYQFDTDEEILDYISYVGNSDVPYPIAYGPEYVYFMLDKKRIKKSDLELEATVANAGDLYGEFYGHVGSKKGKHEKNNFNNVVVLHERI